MITTDTITTTTNTTKITIYKHTITIVLSIVDIVAV